MKTVTAKSGHSYSQETIAGLERSWKPTEAVTSMRDLQGTWLVSTPKEDAPKGLLSGDVPRMMLNLYAGDIGRMLSMELKGAPVLHISADGQTTTETTLRWGTQEDAITLEGTLECVAPNVLRETPKSTKSKALNLKWPAMQQQRHMKVTFYDGKVLILRDRRGIVDVLWRQDTNEPVVYGSEGGSAKISPEDRLEPVVYGAAGRKTARKPSAADEVHGLLQQVHSLSSSLEGLRNQSGEDHEARLKLGSEMERLEKELRKVTEKAGADSVILTALEKLNRKVSGVFDAKSEKAEAKTQAYNELQEEIDSIEEARANLQGNLARWEVRETNLLQEIQVLKSQLREGRAPRLALQQAKTELDAVRQDLRNAKKEVTQQRGELRETQNRLEKAQKSMDKEVSAARKLQEELEDQTKSREEATDRLAQQAQVEQELRQELWKVREELAELQIREEQSREVAAEMEEEIDNLLREAKSAQQALEKAAPRKTRRFWPFR